MIQRLPPQSTPLVGRNDALEDIAELLANPACRLLTLAGPGGVGKTSLALAVAHTQIDAYSGAVFFIPLASVSMVDHIISTVADALQITFHSEADPAGQIFEFLEGRRMLLVVDNLEHLVDGAVFLSDMLQHAADVNILVTSRERLNLREEWVYEVEGLAIPDTDSRQDDLENYSALQMFVQTAQRTRGDFSLTDANRQCVIHICELVGGLPLGIELAAAWVKMLTCQEIEQEIERNLDFLATTYRNVPERQRSLRAAFDYSWTLLSDEERDALRRLSVFHGGFSRVAAMEVAGVNLAQISALVDKSLLVPDKSGRYKAHEALAQFTVDFLDAKPEEGDRFRAAHSSYFAAFLQQRQQQLVQEKDKRVFEEVRDEMDNLRAAWSWAVSHGDGQGIRTFSHGLYALFTVRGWYQDGTQTFETAIQVVREQLASGTDSNRNGELTLGVLLGFEGALRRYLGQFDRAREMLEESIAILRRRGAKREIRRPLFYLALIANAQGHKEEAKKLLDEGLLISSELGDQYKLSAHLAILGDIAYQKGEYEEAKDNYRKALAHSREIGAQTGVARSFTRLGIVSEAAGEYAAATQFLQRSLEISSGLNDPREMARSLAPMGRVAAAQGNREEAKSLLLDALGIAMEVGAAPSALDALVGMANLMRTEGELEFAIELLALVIDHPSSEQDTRERAEQGFAEATAGLSPEKIRAARDTGKSMSLEAAVAALSSKKEQMAGVMQVRDETMNLFINDLRDPLGLARSALGMLEMTADFDPGGDTGRFVMMAAGGLQRIRNLVDSMLDIERLSEGESALTLVEVDMVALLTEVVSQQHPIAATMQVGLSAQVPPAYDVPRMRADHNRIERVVTILIDNALNATPPGGQATISLRQAENMLEIAVTDTGDGLSEEQKAHIFDILVQTDEAQEARSARLDLAYCRVAVEAHGGTIRVEHCDSGTGTRFVFTLPVMRR